MSSRPQVYSAIDTERDYQDKLGEQDNRTDGKDSSVGDYITMMGYYYQTMVKEWTLNAGDSKALEVMRKMAGIAVHCMEDHGAPVREVKNGKDSC